MRSLVIEDEPQIRAYRRHLLGQLNGIVDIVGSVSDAQQALSSVRYDALTAFCARFVKTFSAVTSVPSTSASTREIFRFSLPSRTSVVLEDVGIRING